MAMPAASDGLFYFVFGQTEILAEMKGFMIGQKHFVSS
jgi:hypothetical protein